MNLDSILNIVQAALGVGLVIFVHEAGHFWAARWCKVRVEVFSIGFGPKIYSWTRGDTEYQIAAVPLGGYVKMAGEDIYDPEAKRLPDDLGSKSVPQRLLIYSGGVIMNMIFALIVFPIILMIGVPFSQPMITPVEGGAAWLAGLEEGTVIEEIDGNPIYAFMHIGNGIALSEEGGVEMLIREPGATESRLVHIDPIKSETMGLYVIGVDRAVDPEHRIFVEPDSAASKAGLRTGFRLLDVESENPELSLLRRYGQAVGSQGPFTATFLDDNDQELTLTLSPEALEANSQMRLGVMALANRVKRARKTELTSKLDLKPGNLILSVNGKPILSPSDLRHSLSEAEGPVTMSIKQDGLNRTVELGVLDRAAGLTLASNIALGQDVTGERINVGRDSAAQRAGLQSGDTVIEIDETEIESFNDISERVSASTAEDRAMSVTVSRTAQDGTSKELTVEVRAEPYTPLSPGFALQPATYVYQADGPLDAINVGLTSSWRMIEDLVVTLKGMLFTDRVDPKNLGGIVTIAVAANSFAESGFTKLFFFLCLLSVNLAFLNVLPIPVLDGGHMTFLLIEAIKGSPVSEKVMGYSQLVGLVMIVSLMIYVIKNDIVRFFLT